MPTTVPETASPDTASTEREIAQARQQMGQALFLLADRLAPKKLIARLKEKAKLKANEKLAELKEKVNPANIIGRRLNGDSSPQRVITARGYESNGKARSSLPRAGG